MEKVLISVVGPTGIGKTKLAIMLAKHFKTEIISADSRQFFKELEIGTAVPTKEELNAVPHHFVQHISIQDTYTVGDFEKDALTRLQEIFKHKEYAIMVGGSGLYTDAVVNGLDTFPKIEPGIRKGLNEALKEKGIGYLQEKLAILDKTYYATMDRDNPHRLIRALEICMGTGKPYSSFLNKGKKKRPFRTLTIGLSAAREIIYDRINRRVAMMLADGLVEEAKQVYKDRNLNALQTVGYKELFTYFDGDCDLDSAIAEIKKNTRRFAKRQLTWYRKNEAIVWFDINDNEDTVLHKLNEVLDVISNE